MISRFNQRRGFTRKSDMIKKLSILISLILSIVAVVFFLRHDTHPPQEEIAYTGTYIFDAPAFKLTLKHLDHPIMDGPQEIFDDLLEELNGYKIIVTKDEVTTHFKKIKSKGKLILISETNGEFKFNMIPQNVKINKHEVMYVFTKNALLIDPLDQPGLKLFFKKMK